MGLDCGSATALWMLALPRAVAGKFLVSVKSHFESMDHLHERPGATASRG